MFAEFDRDRDGVLSFDEFARIAERYPEYLRFAQDALLPDVAVSTTTAAPTTVPPSAAPPRPETPAETAPLMIPPPPVSYHTGTAQDSEPRQRTARLEVVDV